MLEYQKQNCNLTLQEGLNCYYEAFPETTEIFEDNENLLSIKKKLVEELYTLRFFILDNSL